MHILVYNVYYGKYEFLVGMYANEFVLVYDCLGLSKCPSYGYVRLCVYKLQTGSICICYGTYVFLVSLYYF